MEGTSLSSPHFPITSAKQLSGYFSEQFKGQLTEAIRGGPVLQLNI